MANPAILWWDIYWTFNNLLYSVYYYTFMWSDGSHIWTLPFSSDFLTRSYDIGGVISVMALSGLFILMTQHGLEYPKFYEKLYALLTPAVFMAKHRAVFFQVSYIPYAFVRNILIISICLLLLSRNSVPIHRPEGYGYIILLAWSDQILLLLATVTCNIVIMLLYSYLWTCFLLP